MNDRNFVKLHPDLFFANGVSRIDFILVYRLNTLENDPVAKRRLNIFLKDMFDSGLEAEFSKDSVDQDLYYILIHAPREVLLLYVEKYDLEVAFNNKNFKPKDKPSIFTCTHTVLTKPRPTSSIYKRSREYVDDEHPKDFTTSDSILIVSNMLSVTKFGPNPGDRGYQKLIYKGVLVDGYPLHVGECQWRTKGPLSARQLLGEYWANGKMWNKEQPMRLIERYYGPETAFYFSWFGYYNTMLGILGILGVICFSLDLAIFGNTKILRDEICSSEKVLCPKCDPTVCRITFVKDSCTYAKLTGLLDNFGGFVFSIVITIWGSIFIECWKRKEILHQMNWDLENIVPDTTLRLKYEERTRRIRLSPITGELEHYENPCLKFIRVFLSISTCILLVSLVVSGIIGIVVYRSIVHYYILSQGVSPTLRQNVSLLASASASALSVTFILITDKIYRHFSGWLTEMENPRTEDEYENNYIYKTYCLAFVNNYAIIFYLAFFKGQFYTYPGDQSMYTTWGSFKLDQCDASGCIVDVTLQIALILTFKQLCRCFLDTIKPYLSLKRRVIKNKKYENFKRIPQWEKDFLLSFTDRHYFSNEYMDLVIQYGYVKFFAVVFPLAPLLALASNAFELRMDACKLHRFFRRPIPRRISGLGAWNGILEGVTWLGIVINGFLMAINKNHISKVVYMATYQKKNLEGYIDSTLSEFDVKDYNFEELPAHLANTTKCYYVGFRHPPDHPKKYTYTFQSHYVTVASAVSLLIFEHVMVLASGIVTYLIPKMPASVKERRIFYQTEQLRLKRQEIQQKAMADPKRSKKGRFSFS